LTELFAEAVFGKVPGGKVIYAVRASRAVPETIERAGGTPLVSRVGHAFIKQRMRAEGAVFAGEVSAHYYFRDFSQADTGVVPFPVMLAPLSRRAAPPPTPPSAGPARGAGGAQGPPAVEDVPAAAAISAS